MTAGKRISDHLDDAQFPLDRVHVDAQSYPVPGRKGELYMIGMYDEYTKYGIV
jgi:hypothetical protein